MIYFLVNDITFLNVVYKIKQKQCNNTTFKIWNEININKSIIIDINNGVNEDEEDHCKYKTL